MVTQMEKPTKPLLLDLRIDAGFDSQLELARAAGLGESTIWLAENGRTISRKSARKIINALKEKGVEASIEDILWQVK